MRERDRLVLFLCRGVNPILIVVALCTPPCSWTWGMVFPIALLWGGVLSTFYEEHNRIIRERRESRAREVTARVESVSYPPSTLSSREHTRLLMEYLAQQSRR